jgi:hypothetical protein
MPGILKYTNTQNKNLKIFVKAATIANTITIITSETNNSTIVNALLFFI